MLNIKKILLSLSLLFTLQVTIYGQEVLKLDSILKIISTNNLELKAYNSLIKSENAAVGGAKAQPAPVVGIGNFTKPYSNKRLAPGDYRGDFMITAEQEIMNPAKLKANENYLKSKSAITAYQQAANYNELKATAKSLYFEVIIAKKQLQFQKDNARILSNLKKLAEIRYPYNKGGLAMIYEAEGKIYETENTILGLNSKIQSNQLKLNLLMNRAADTPFEVDTSYQISFKPIKQIDDTFLSSRVSNLKELDEKVKSAELNTKLLQQQFKPDLKLGFEHMSPYQNAGPLNYTARIGITIPIAPWSVKSYQSAIKANNFEILAIKEQKDAMLNNLTSIVKSAEIELTFHEHQHHNFKDKIIPTMQKNLDVLMLNYQENKAELTEVLNAWQNLNNAQNNYLNEINDYSQMIILYEKALEL